jgi:hypothetical protein
LPSLTGRDVRQGQFNDAKFQKPKENEMKRILVTGFSILALLSAIVHAAANDIPMKGRGNGVISGVNPGPGGVEITASGSGEATQLGRYTRTELIVLNPFTGTLTGTIVFMAANGDELYCDVAGAFTGANTASGTYYFTGGSGRFENASGEAAFDITQTDQTNFSVIFEGTIDLD